MQKKLTCKSGVVMLKTLNNTIKTIFIVFSLLFIFSACTENEMKYTEDELARIADLQDISESIQKDLNELNHEVSSKNQNKAKAIRDEVSQFDNYVNEVADLLNESIPYKEDFLAAADVYQKIIYIYKTHGIKVDKIENEINQLRTKANKLRNINE